MCQGSMSGDSNPFSADCLLSHSGRFTASAPGFFLSLFKLKVADTAGGTTITESDLAAVATTIVFRFPPSVETEFASCALTTLNEPANKTEQSKNRDDRSICCT